MKPYAIIAWIWLLALAAKAQVYTHPTTGIAGEYVGACMVNTCSGTYYDNGGAGGNYSNFINNIYRVFCPNTPGTCLRATFTSFSTEPGPGPGPPGPPGPVCYDFLTVSNGSTQNSPVLWAGCGTGIPGPFTGTNNGCLTFRFYSDNTITQSGWAINFSCVPCANGPSATNNGDCAGAAIVCSPVSIPGNSPGPGLSSDACGGGGCPAGGENYSNWYAVSFTAAGTFTFLINPTVASDDYDYAVYGPNVGCGALGPAIRCSDSELTGVTGLSAAATDFTESVTGDKFTAPLNVLAGQTYYIMVDEWTPTGGGYNLTFGGTATMSCVVTPVEFASFTAKYQQAEKAVLLNWSTASELNNDYFVVERSLDGDIYEQIDVVQGAGNSSTLRNYKSRDERPYPGEINYYRIKQVDTNGQFSYSNLEAIAINDPQLQFGVFPNPAKDMAMVTYNTAWEGERCVLAVYDHMAKKVLEYPFIGRKGLNQLPLDISQYPRGVYFITLQNSQVLLRNILVKE